MPLQPEQAFGPILNAVDLIAEDAKQKRLESRQERLIGEQRQYQKQVQDRQYQNSFLQSLISDKNVEPQVKNEALKRQMDLLGQDIPLPVEGAFGKPLTIPSTEAFSVFGIPPGTPVPMKQAESLMGLSKQYADLETSEDLKKTRRTQRELDQERLNILRNPKPKGSSLTLKDAVMDAKTRLNSIERDENADPEMKKAAQERYDMLKGLMDKELGIEQPQNTEKQAKQPKAQGGFVKQRQTEVTNNAKTAIQNLVNQYRSNPDPQAYQQNLGALYLELQQSLGREQAQQLIREQLGIK
jgi:hypothetical protein